MRSTVSDSMTSWDEFLSWCVTQGKEPKYYSTMQEYLSQKSQERQSC